MDNLPYGVFSVSGTAEHKVGVAIGDYVLDAGAAATAVGSGAQSLLAAPSLDQLMASGPSSWSAVRAELTEWLADTSFRDEVEPHLRPIPDVDLHLPFTVADYVDFYASEHHASNVGKILRPGTPPLPPQWKHLPIGYHGRAGTIAASGTDVHRPWGQRRQGDATEAVFAPTAKLDFEAEVGFVVGAPSRPGTPVGVRSFAEHVFGVCLLNDWSARDIQSFEYVPLGPMLGKSFLTSVSPWVVPLAALAPARIDPPARSPEPLPHLQDAGERWGLDITLEVRLNGTSISRPPFSAMYWTAAQQLAHLTSNGAHVRCGDLLASGTVSGPREDQMGCLLELAWGGERPFTMAGGRRLTFLEDGDEVVISATAPGADGARIGFGEVRGLICG